MAFEPKISREDQTVDIIKQDGEYRVQAELPKGRPDAVELEFIDIQVADDTLARRIARAIRLEFSEESPEGRDELVDLLDEAESFMSGFEGDDTQEESIDGLLDRIRAAISAARNGQAVPRSQETEAA